MLVHGSQSHEVLMKALLLSQAQLTERALELLALPDDGRMKMLLDLGCGSGLSGEALTEQGHCWVVSGVHFSGVQFINFAISFIVQMGHIWSLALLQGMDISEAMLDVAREREVEGDLCLHDLGDGLPLRTGTFDGAISISAVQWLCNAVSRTPLHLSGA